MTRTLSQIEKEIEQTKEQLQNVHGTETEVYARIVGYYRAVKHWNKGKKDEFNQRKMFTLEDASYDLTQADKECAFCENTSSSTSKKEDAPVMNAKCVTYEMYTKKTCPNCPPVKAFMADLQMNGRSIDVDTNEGLEEAAQKGVFASPTVIFYNEEGIETARCHCVEELEAVFNNVCVIA